VVACYRLKITDLAIALFTGLLVLVGAIQAIRLRQTMIATKAAADALPILERAYVSLGIGLVPKITGPAQPPPAFAAAAHRAGLVKTRTRQVEEATAELGVVNYGKTPAFIYEISYAFAPIENPENIPPYPPSSSKQRS
jgi:hypothetical protein